MPDKDFSNLTQEQADEIAKAAYAKGDWETLSKLGVPISSVNWLPGVPVKTTLGAKDIR